MPLSGVLEAGDQIEDRGLAGAVGADQAQHLAAVELEADVVDGADTAEVLRQAPYFEDLGQMHALFVEVG